MQPRNGNGGASKRLREVLRQLVPEGQQKAVSVRAGLARETIWRLRDDKKTEPNPRLDTLTALSRELRVPVSQLLGEEPVSGGVEAVEIAEEEFGLLPLVSEAVAAGSPAIQHDGDIEDRYAFRLDFLHKYPSPPGRDRLVLVKVASGRQGDSMVPTIQPGALLVIDRGSQAEGWSEIDHGGDIYLVRPPDQEGVTVKRLFRSGDQLVLWSDNPTHDPQVVSLRGRQLQRIAVGRVRWVAQEMP